MIPRIQGKVGQATAPEEMKGKWFFEIWLTSIGGGEGESMGVFGPWASEAEAKAELQKAAQLAAQAAEKGLTGKISGQYIDMKTNSIRRWDKADEH